MKQVVSTPSKRLVKAVFHVRISTHWGALFNLSVKSKLFCAPQKKKKRISRKFDGFKKTSQSVVLTG